MTPGILNLKIYQGATFRRTVTINNSLGVAINLTGATARMQIREFIAATTTIIELNEANGRALITDAAGGVITLMIADEDTALLTFAKAVYDLEVEYADGTVDRVLQGTVTLSLEVTR